MRRWLVSAWVIAGCGSNEPPPVVAVPPAPTVVEIATAEPAPPPVTPSDARAPQGEASVTEAMLREWSKATLCQQFDYHPRGGIQSFWCHRPARLTMKAVATLAGVDIFASGPHSPDELKLDSASDFGHYNPAFVKWLIEQAAPSARDSSVRAATQAAYDEQLKPLATVFHYTLAKARKDADCFARERTTYADLIKRKKLPNDYYERWFYFMNPGFCEKAKLGLRPESAFAYFSDNGFDAGVNGNVTKSVVGFWLRRSMDGTMDAFADGLSKLLAAYDPELVAHPYRAPPAQALIDAAITRGMAKAQTCKAKGKPTPIHLSVWLDPSGMLTATIPAVRRAGNGTLQSQCVEGSFVDKLAPFDGVRLEYSRNLVFQ